MGLFLKPLGEIARRVGQAMSRKPTPALWRAYRIDLVVLNDAMKAAAQGDPARYDASVDALLSEQQVNPSWEKLYEAEQRLARLMSDEQIRTEAARRFVEAEQFDLPTLDALKNQFEAAAIDDPATPKNAEIRKQVFLRLLDEIHFSYAKRKLSRMQRKHNALVLSYMGAAIVVGPCLLLIWVWRDGTLTPLARFHVPLIAWCGAMGAYFSRIVSFQGVVNTADYDVLRDGYSLWSLSIRLIIGVIAALIMYFLILSGLISGEIFPDIEKETWKDADARSLRVAPQSETKNELTTPPVSASYAKLLIWCTIAGFSERLIPDRLAALGEASREHHSPASRP